VAMPPIGTRNDPYRTFNFRLEIDGTAVAGFRECSGLTFTTDPIEYREGTDLLLSPRKLTGQTKYANVVCRRGMTQDETLWGWYLNVVNGTDDRRNGSVVLQDEQHNDVHRWEFEQGWITKWEGPTFNATSNEVAIEAIEIAVERVELQ
jgi:phage tail-like protein